MLDLTKYELQNSIFVKNKSYTIRTDFKYWLRFFQILNEEKQPLFIDFDFLYCDYINVTKTKIEKKGIFRKLVRYNDIELNIPEDRKAGFEKLFEFANPKNILPRDTGGKSEKIIDYIIDSDYIYSAFYEQYGIDLINDKLHWHKFLALLKGLHDTKLNEIMSYRSYDENNKDDYKKCMIKARESWKLDQQIEMSEKEQEIKDKFESQLK